MCGIVGYVGSNKAIDVLIDGLERLEYRGYDSAGVAFIKNNKLNIIKTEGKIKNLKDKIDFNNKSNIGIGHTRWATHGIASENNSHPHKVGKITIVHNGIIENYQELKTYLIEQGYKFNTETDTEVACALLDYLYNKYHDMKSIIIKFKELATGAYALGIMCDDELDKLYAIKNASPLIIGVGDNESFIASDVPAILKYTNKYITLDDMDYAILTKNKITCFNKDNKEVKKNINTFSSSLSNIEKNGYEHFMLKEINEEPSVIKDTTKNYTASGIDSLMDNMPDFSKYSKISIVACGSAYHAGLVGKNLIEEFANIPVSVEIASEYRYKKHFFDNKELLIAISQSGETADTLAAINIAKKNNIDTLGIINVEESSIARSTDKVLYTKAGNEIAVATTKAYLSQVAMLSLIALNLANKNNNIDKKEIIEVLKEINTLPIKIQELLNKKDYKEIAKILYNHEDIFFLGRGIDYALAMEGSLKLKEISYIHSEAYPAGELKHGTISLIEDGTPVVSIITDEIIAKKTISNVKETKSRGAHEIIIATNDIDIESDLANYKLVIPKIHKLLQPILTVIPLQMISYEVAKLRECDIDKPKNLAKSVTVE